MWEFDNIGFLGQFFSNTLGTVTGGLILYFILQKPIEKIFIEESTKRLLKNLAGDLIYNFVKAEKILEKRDEYLKQNRFSLSRYRTQYLNEFYYQKPLKEEDKFPYIKLMALHDRLESDNMLRDSIFSQFETEVQLNNKKQFIANAEQRQKEIKEFLSTIEIFYGRYNLVLTEFS